MLRHEVARALAGDFEVIDVPDGVAALQAAHEHLPELVVSDLATPGIDGIELLAALRGDPRTRSVPVIFVGERADPGPRDHHSAREPDDYLVRPFAAPELVTRVHRHIALRQAQRAWAIEYERAARELVGADQEDWRRAARDVPLLAEVQRREVKRELVDLTAIAREIAAELRVRDPARSVDVRVDDGLAAVADRALVTIALEQLLGNAWRFTSKRTDAAIVVESQHPGVFLVRDNGAGFDMARGSELEGAGIGLAIVRRIIERHGGECWVHGLVDRGATVRFTLGADSEPPVEDRR